MTIFIIIRIVGEKRGLRNFTLVVAVALFDGTQENRAQESPSIHLLSEQLCRLFVESAPLNMPISSHQSSAVPRSATRCMARTEAFPL